MKLAFVVAEMPPCLYIAGEGKCRSTVVPVEVPDEFFPNEIVKLKNADLDKSHKFITDIMIMKEDE